jgi:hypothetical protein
MGQVDNGSDVRLLGRVCVERRGAPGRLAGWVALPACWAARGLHVLERPGRLGRFGWATREWRKGEEKGATSWARLCFQLSFGPLPNRS